MIYSIHTNYDKECPSEFYMVAAIDGEKSQPRKLFPERVEFKPGLNIITGRNGSGKTTLLKALWTTSLYAGVPDGDEFMGGRHTSRRELENVFDLEKMYSMAYLTGKDQETKTEIQERGFFDIRMDFNAPIYMMQEIASFSEDKILSSSKNLSYHYYNQHSSKGEQLYMSIVRFSRQVKDTKEERKNYSFESLLKKLDTNKPALDSAIRKYIEKHQEEGVFCQPTLLMDEMDAGLDVFGLAEVRKWLENASKNFQVIVALHNPALVQAFKGTANFIEMTENYVDVVERFAGGEDILGQ